MHELTLPPFGHKLTQSGQNVMIWDGLRRKYVVLTPEEWVRQHVVHYLADHLGYPRSLLSLERGHAYNQRRKRTDLCAFGPNGRVLLLVECKAATVRIDATVAHQAATYNQTIGAPLLLLTNGVQHFCWHVDPVNRTNRRLDFIPDFETAKQLASPAASQPEETSQ
ncbi:type I restriction enzyme HsdR N-terminal domain-containing protein [Hymenobacter sp. BT175]|uniref:type I restriction enzyme HsdR N-terminal domain-containing protein n=1 Tax=Hymenobacter translucens TaxID=2886507 RepID=UPI001D0F18A6|nr:type I restriction enzyme HsdR N-terminal domain-containing protein [Hymenobacter translucens]MCC2545326.1 type I restriction enzyme HsdR N-terminal domain-containing protein [Hymenobacter translucens]